MKTPAIKYLLSFFNELGGISDLLWKVLSNAKYIYKDRKLFIEQAIRLGFDSIPLVLLVGIFTGAVSVWQANYQFEGYIPLKYLGSAVFKALVIELAPVLTGLVIAGRVSASIAAELGTMKVTEQIDALESLAINPVRFLLLPRFAANTFMMPVLVTFAGGIAVLGGYVVANTFLGITGTTFFAEIPRHFYLYDIFVCMLKSLVFGATTSLMGCYIGYTTEGGAEGVGKATIKAFVSSSVLILTFDYILAAILF